MTYTTVQGDMWDSVAFKVFNDCSYTDKIIALNMEYHNTYIFPAGVVLQMPERTVDVRSTLPPWKVGAR